MDYFEILKQRRSTRTFLDKPVEEEKLQKILEAANAAPSAGNQQAYEIYVVKLAAKRAAVARSAFNQNFVGEAPVVLVFCTHASRSTEKYGRRGAQLYAIQDATIAGTRAMLATTALGLATVWVGAFDDEAVWRAIGAPQEMLPVAILPVGYAAETPQPTPRRDLDTLVHEVV